MAGTYKWYFVILWMQVQWWVYHEMVGTQTLSTSAVPEHKCWRHLLHTCTCAHVAKFGCWNLLIFISWRRANKESWESSKMFQKSFNDLIKWIMLLCNQLRWSMLFTILLLQGCWHHTLFIIICWAVTTCNKRNIWSFTKSRVIPSCLVSWKFWEEWQRFLIW